MFGNFNQEKTRKFIFHKYIIKQITAIIIVIVIKQQ